MARLHKSMHESLNDEALRKLRILNVNTVADFFEQDDDRLEKILKIHRKEVEDMKVTFLTSFGGNVQSGRELLRFEEDNILSTGISSLDVLLNGGLHPGELYEFCGLSSAGKTQLCHSIATNVVLGRNGTVRYIDTKKDFSGTRIQTILDGRNKSDAEIARVMSQISVTRVTSVYELMSVLYDLTWTRSESTGDMNDRESSATTRLLVIDSLPSLFLCSAENTDAQRALNHLAGVLKFLAKKFRASVITCNLVTKWRDVDGFGEASLAERPVVIKAFLGRFWQHAPNTRLHIERMPDEERRRISVWKSFQSRIGDSCVLHLSDAGFT